jgi:bifunctional DNA-binding transcriptional regulator/antitoxin component of YhaV-PrlF toxin-antitoxin module
MKQRIAKLTAGRLNKKIATYRLTVWKKLIEELGWKEGDYVILIPDFQNKTLTVKKLEISE